MTDIVIGVDGSESADRAVRWGAREAELRDGKVVAVLAWGLLNQHHNDLAAPFDPDYSEAQADDALGAYLDRALSSDRAATIDRRVVCDLPARALLDAATGADLLVVGPADWGASRPCCSVR